MCNAPSQAEMQQPPQGSAGSGRSASPGQPQRRVKDSMTQEPPSRDYIDARYGDSPDEDGDTTTIWSSRGEAKHRT